VGALLGVVPFLAYVTLFLLIPTLVVIVGAFADGSGRPTLANLSALGQPQVVAALVHSVVLSAVTAVVGALIGALLAYAVSTAREGGLLRRLVTSLCGVLAQFGGVTLAFAFVATVVCSDTGGYVTGVLFGRHPLAPIVSKAKTWEGFAGSIAFCAAAGIGFLTLTFHQAWWKGLLYGLAIVVTATLGDLGESMIKRDLEVKDMGSLLPGHGGMMDRLDSLLPCAAVAYLLLSGFAPVG